MKIEKKFIYIKEQIWESAKLQVMRNIESMNHFKICQFLEFEIEKNLKLIFFLTYEVLEIR